MDSLLLTLTFFLLFSPLDSMQNSLFTEFSGNYTLQDELALKKDISMFYEEAVLKAQELGLELPKSYYTEKKDEYFDFLYDDDNGYSSDLSDELENPILGEQGASSTLVNYDEKLFDGISNIGEKVYLSENFTLRILKSGLENFSIKKNFEKTETVHLNEDYFIRYLEDENHNVREKNIFKNGKNISEISMKSRSFYDYCEVNLVRSVFEDYENKIVSVTMYDNFKNPINVKNYKMLDSDLFKEGKNYNFAISLNDHVVLDEIIRKFDSNGRILSEEKFVYKINEFGRKITEESKNVFSYTDKSSKPNYIYYEDGVICLSVEYSGEASYIEKVFFGGKYEVSTKYVDGKKITETFYENGKEIRRRSFQ